ncbi:MAG: O-antigen ligase family protein [Candidatus Hydrogenedentota bacterium]
MPQPPMTHFDESSTGETMSPSLPSDGDALPPRATSSLWRAVRGWLVCAVLVACAVAYAFPLSSFLHAKDAVFMTGLAMAAGVLLAETWRAPAAAAGAVQGLRAFTPLWLFLLFSLFAHAALGQARVPTDTVLEIVRLAALLALAPVMWDLAFEAQWRQRFLGALIVAAVVVALLALGQFAGWLDRLFPPQPGYTQPMYSVFGNQNLLGGFVALGFVLAVYKALDATRLFLYWAAGAAALGVALLLSESRTAWLAAAVGLLWAIGPMRRSPRRAAILAGVGAVAVIAAVAAAGPETLSERLTDPFGAEDVGGRARLWFWEGAWRMFLSAPLVGVGLGNFPYWSPHFQGAALHAPGGEAHYHNELHTVYAHSDPLQLLATAGVIGMLFLGWMAWRLRGVRGITLGGLATLAVFACFNFPLASAPHAAAGVVLATLVLAERRGGKTHPIHMPNAHTTRNAPPASRRLCTVTAAAVFAGTLGAAFFYCAAVLPPSHWLRMAENQALEGESGLDDYRRAAEHFWPNPRALERYGYALAREGRKEEAREVLEQALQYRDTGSLHMMLAAVASRLSDEQTMRTHADEARFRIPGEGAAWFLALAARSQAEWPALREEALQWLDPGEWERITEKARGVRERIEAGAPRRSAAEFSRRAVP